MPEARNGLFSLLARVARDLPMGRREAMKCLRPAVSWGQAPRGKTDTAGASGPPVLSARWCAVVHNEEDRGRDKRNIKDGMFGYSTQTW